MPSPHFTQPVCLCRQAIEKNSLLAPEGICLPLNRGINQLVRPRTPRRVPPTNQQRSFSSFRSSDLTAMTDPNNNWAGEDPTTVLPRRKKGRQRIAPVALKLKSLRRLSGRLYVNRTALSPPFHRSKSTELSLLFLLLIVFLLFRLRTLGLSAGVLLFVLYWLVRLVSRFLIRTRFLRIAMLWVTIFLI